MNPGTQALPVKIVFRSLLLAVGLVIAADAQAPQSPPGNRNSRPVDQAAAARGKKILTQNCGFCHGADAHGGAEGGPDLTHSSIVTGDPTGKRLSDFLKVGRPPRMPAFNLPEAQVSDLLDYVRSQTSGSSRGAGTNEVAIVGDAKSGEAYFNGAGQCATCHSVTGDFKGIGSRYSSLMLEGRIVLPRGDGGYPGLQFPGQQTGPPDLPKTAVITMPSGEVVSGKLLYISDFYVSVQDASGVRHTMTRNEDSPKVEIHDPIQAHLDRISTWTDKNLHDLTAYLITLK